MSVGNGWGSGNHWDYIIIGAGSAGCALANELARGCKGQSILVLEAGGSDRSPLIRFPAGSLKTAEFWDWGYWSQPDPSRNGAKERWDRGRVLGGCSSVNSTVFVRGARHDFDRWAKSLGGDSGERWSSSEVMPLFSELETSDQENEYRGESGPLYVRTVRRPHLATQAFLQAAIACGYAFNEDYNGADQEGVSYAQLNQRSGLRCSSSDAFLRPLLRSGGNVTLMLNAWVRKIELRDGRAVAVQFKRDSDDCREEGRNIIVCSGAINSPSLLMQSGIGDAEELVRHNIPVVLHLPEVGRHLRDHPRITMVYEAKEQTNSLTGGLLQKLGIAATYLATREGPISNIFEGVGFLRSAPSEPHPDIQLHFTPIGLAKNVESSALAPYPSVTVVVNKNYPASSGRIRLSSNDPQVAPLIECRLLEQEEDVDTLVRGVEKVRQIMQSEPIASLLKKETMPGGHVATEPALRDYVRANTEITYHFSGTCRMGTDAASVVDAEMRVRGTENLYVADASIMPDLISGNTNAVCMMIGKKLGRQFVTHHRLTG